MGAFHARQLLLPPARPVRRPDRHVRAVPAVACSSASTPTTTSTSTARSTTCPNSTIRGTSSSTGAAGSSSAVGQGAWEEDARRRHARAPGGPAPEGHTGHVRLLGPRRGASLVLVAEDAAPPPTGTVGRLKTTPPSLLLAFAVVGVLVVAGCGPTAEVVATPTPPAPISTRRQDGGWPDARAAYRPAPRARRAAHRRLRRRRLRRHAERGADRTGHAPRRLHLATTDRLSERGRVRGHFRGRHAGGFCGSRLCGHARRGLLRPPPGSRVAVDRRPNVGGRRRIRPCSSSLQRTWSHWATRCSCSERSRRAVSTLTRSARSRPTRDGPIWRSASGGPWERLPQLAAMQTGAVDGATAAHGNLVCFGWTGDESLPTIWTSPDGVSWNQTSDLAEIEQVTAVAGTPSGLVAFGTGYSPELDDLELVVAASSDGSHFGRTDAPQLAGDGNPIGRGPGERPRRSRRHRGR